MLLLLKISRIRAKDAASERIELLLLVVVDGYIFSMHTHIQTHCVCVSTGKTHENALTQSDDGTLFVCIIIVVVVVMHGMQTFLVMRCKYHL